MKSIWKKTGKVAVMVTATMAFGLTGCGGSGGEDSGSDDAAKKDSEAVKVTLLAGGYGDKSFNDSARAGVEAVEKEYPGKVEINVVDMSTDTKKWQAAMYEAGDSDTDIIVTGGFQQTDNVQEIAEQYPDKKWISYDTVLDYEAYDLQNVYSMGYNSNESGYLAGMVAAYVTTSGAEGTNPDKVIGFVGGIENTPSVDDFLVGYIEGAQAVDPEIKVVSSYVNNFDDSAKGKEIALSQINSDKVDIIFAAAGAAGTGCIEAASDSGTFFIGVDSDQSLEYEGKPEQAVIVTSAMKRVDQSIINAVGRSLEGTLPYGEYEKLGMKDDCVGIVENELYEKNVPEAGRTAITQAENDLRDGKIEVKSAYDMTSDEVKAMADSARP